MTRFWRDGFYRTSVYGHTHWVEGHWVERDGWDRGSYGSQSSYFSGLLRDARASRTATACFVTPNAECPVCGAEVFFYRNEFGSQVYFDELGPPWPKHPCTDSARYASAESPVLQAGNVLQPVLRTENEISAIHYWHGGAGTDPSVGFQWRYGHKAWRRVRVVRRIKIAEGTLLAVQIGKDDGEQEAFLKCKSLPGYFKEGSVAFLKRQTLSFLDMAAMAPREATVERVKSLSAAVRCLSK